ncbi:MAG: hypothetical protein CM15mP4_0920 [Candidatus Neomarinimicrobiota bacterium]|nr:MAG: hypothetical protein CM15mP4_0920 [Candidatus Neomarinimicrobiota bacterium]
MIGSGYLLILIDDGDNGFQRYQGPNWSYFNFGYDNDSWSAPATTSANDSRHFFNLGALFRKFWHFMM